MKKLLFLSFLLVSLNINASSDLRERIPTSDLDFDFLRVKVRELLNDAVATAVLFDEEIKKLLKMVIKISLMKCQPGD